MSCTQHPEKMLRSLLLLHLLVLGSSASAFFTDPSEEFYRSDAIKVLITSSTNMQFLKENNPDGTKRITYDCFLGLTNSGIIKAGDDIHPVDMRSLIIKNCDDITLRSGKDIPALEEIKISNVRSLKLSSRTYYGNYYGVLDSLNISITDVDELNIESESLRDLQRLSNKGTITLKIQNVTIDTISCEGSNCEKIESLHLKNVKIPESRSFNVLMRGCPDAVFTAENSHFEKLPKGGFTFNGSTFEIINSTFGSLDDGAFLIGATQSFVFSGNHVRKMRNPFYVTSPSVEITSNTFDVTQKLWLSQIISQGFETLAVVNVSGNWMNSWPYDFFYMEQKNIPDVIIFDNNSFYCTCRYIGLFAYKTENFVQNAILNKNRQNVCVNLGNCPLHKVLSKAADVCSGTFRCPAGDETDENPSELKSILSVLQSIDKKLDYFVGSHNASLVDAMIPAS